MKNANAAMTWKQWATCSRWNQVADCGRASAPFGFAFLSAAYEWRRRTVWTISQTKTPSFPRIKHLSVMSKAIGNRSKRQISSQIFSACFEIDAQSEILQEEGSSWSSSHQPLCWVSSLRETGLNWLLLHDCSDICWLVWLFRSETAPVIILNHL